MASREGDRAPGAARSRDAGGAGAAPGAAGRREGTRGARSRGGTAPGAPRARQPAGGARAAARRPHWLGARRGGEGPGLRAAPAAPAAGLHGRVPAHRRAGRRGQHGTLRAGARRRAEAAAASGPRIARQDLRLEPRQGNVAHRDHDRQPGRLAPPRPQLPRHRRYLHDGPHAHARRRFRGGALGAGDGGLLRSAGRALGPRPLLHARGDADRALQQRGRARFAGPRGRAVPRAVAASLRRRPRRDRQERDRRAPADARRGRDREGLRDARAGRRPLPALGPARDAATRPALRDRPRPPRPGDEHRAGRSRATWRGGRAGGRAPADQRRLERRAGAVARGHRRRRAARAAGAAAGGRARARRFLGERRAAVARAQPRAAAGGLAAPGARRVARPADTPVPDGAPRRLDRRRGAWGAAGGARAGAR